MLLQRIVRPRRHYNLSPRGAKNLASRLRVRLRLEAGFRLQPLADLVDRGLHREVSYWSLDVASLNALLPVARRAAVARAIAEQLVESDRKCYFRNLGWYNWRHRCLPRGIPAMDDLYPPNLAVLDFLARRIAHPEHEVLLDYACGIGVLLVYERALGLSRIHGFDNWSYLARSTAEQFLGRFGVDRSVLAQPEELGSIAATIVSCVGYPLALMIETSAVLANPSVRYVLADRMGRPATLPGFRRVGEYPGLLTVFQRSQG
jgi:hypothetical protein